MTYDSASALSAASGQLQQRATAANPFALKPWVVPIKTARSPELAHGSDGSNRCRFEARRIGSSGALSTSALAGLDVAVELPRQPVKSWTGLDLSGPAFFPGWLLPGRKFSRLVFIVRLALLQLGLHIGDLVLGELEPAHLHHLALLEVLQEGQLLCGRGEKEGSISV